MKRAIDHIIHPAAVFMFAALGTLSLILLSSPAILAQDGIDVNAFREQATWHRDDYQPGTISPQDAYDVVADVMSWVWISAPHRLCLVPSRGGMLEVQYEWRDFAGASCRGESRPGGLWDPCYKVSKAFDDYVDVVKDDAAVSVMIEFANDLCVTGLELDSLTVPETRQIFDAFAELSTLSDNELDALIETNVDRILQEAGDQALELEFMAMGSSNDVVASLGLLEDLVEEWQSESVGSDTIAAPSPAPGLSYTSKRFWSVDGEPRGSTMTIESTIANDEQAGYVLREDWHPTLEMLRSSTLLYAASEYANLVAGRIDSSGTRMHEHWKLEFNTEESRVDTVPDPAIPLEWYRFDWGETETCPMCYPLVTGTPVVISDGEQSVQEVSSPGSGTVRSKHNELCVPVGRSEIVIGTQTFRTVDVKCARVTEVEVQSSALNSYAVKNFLTTKSISIDYGILMRQTLSWYEAADTSFRDEALTVTTIHAP